MNIKSTNKAGITKGGQWPKSIYNIIGLYIDSNKGYLYARHYSPDCRIGYCYTPAAQRIYTLKGHIFGENLNFK